MLRTGYTVSTIPSNLSRVPNLLSSQVLLAQLTRTNRGLFNVQEQMATSHRINRFSDDSIGASAISVLQARLDRSERQWRNLQLADGTLNVLDAAIGEASALVDEARGIASDQIGATSDTVTRNAQAVVIDGLIRQMFTLANRQTNGLHIFGGSTPTRAPFVEMPGFGGFRYVATGNGLTADLDSASDVPITLGGNNAIGATSARVRASRDLNPGLTPQTRLADVRGGRGEGISRGPMEFSFDGGPVARINLSGTEDVEDVLAAITGAIRQYETDNGVTVLGPGGVSVSGGSISIDVVTGTPDAQLTFSDVPTGTTAQDLGLSAAPFEATAAVGVDLDPKLTLLSPLSAVSGLTLPMDGLRIKFTLGANSSVREVDLSSAQTIGDVRSLIERAAPGVRVSIGADGRGIDIVNEIAGPTMSIEEIPGAPNTASDLGIRSLDLTTAMSAFNGGRGVSINHGSVDPITGLPDPARDVDFRVTLGSGQAFDVDLQPGDLASVETVLARINQAFTDALGQPPLVSTAPALAAGDFTATLTDGANGITFVQSAGQAAIGPFDIKSRNNSGAAEDLGLLTGSYDAGSASLVAQDRATIRVDNIFTALIELREALRGDSSSGITLAGEYLEAAVNRIGETRALVGVHASRVARAITRLEDSQLRDETVRSQLQDIDYAEAATRYSLLQTQLQAALTAGSQINSLSLLDFIR